MNAAVFGSHGITKCEQHNAHLGKMNQRAGDIMMDLKSISQDLRQIIFVLRCSEADEGDDVTVVHRIARAKVDSALSEASEKATDLQDFVMKIKKMVESVEIDPKRVIA